MESTTKSLAMLQRAAITYPSGNPTAVIFDKLQDADRRILNHRILESWKHHHPDKPELEQCCLVTPATNPQAKVRVEMLGGEFCGNAIRSVVWLITGGQNSRGLIETSGTESPLEYQVRDNVVSLEIPIPQDRPLARKTDEGVLVQMDGICQLIVTDSDLQQKITSRLLLDKLLGENKYNLRDKPCVSVVYYNEATHKAGFCVWIKNVETTFNESASGSGTSAIGIAMSIRTNKPLKLKVIQPSGQIITTETKFSGEPKRIARSLISGKVNVLYDGILKLS